jgi:general secretion pathway protein E
VLQKITDEQVLDVLVTDGLLTKDQVHHIKARLHEQRRKLEQLNKFKPGAFNQRFIHPVTIAEIVAAQAFRHPSRPQSEIDEETVTQAVARHLNIPYKKIDPLKLDLDVVTKIVPQIFAYKHLVLPVKISEGVLEVVMFDPTSREILDDLRRVTTLSISPLMGSKSEILKAIQEFFGFKSAIVAAEGELRPATVDIGNLEQITKLTALGEMQATDQAVIKAVDFLLHYAFDQKASDIHIEPQRDKSRIRLRLDGMLHTIHTVPKTLHAAMVSRIKGLARLDIAERRRPQDGRIKVQHGNRDVEIRVSTIPVAFGEKAVLRILDPTVLFQDLENLGLTSRELILVKGFLQKQHGVIPVTGPTGSGKSTTLYSFLGFLSSDAINITSVEDPVEMVHEAFNQIAVQPIIGITFSSILRNILRQDPDVIMIGEVRDSETAEYSVQAALTGHLVLTTLHTNDAPSSIARLTQLGVKPFLLTEALVGVIAQRLVRKICPYCGENVTVESGMLKTLGISLKNRESLELRHGSGCPKCRSTGYKGRIGVFEVLEMDQNIRETVTGAEDDIGALRKQALAGGMVPLRQNAIAKMVKGITTYEEVIRVTGGVG